MPSTRPQSSAAAASDLSALGERLLEARRRAGLSQTDLARISSVSTRTIGELERAERTSIRHEPIIRLAAALGDAPREWLDAADHADISDEIVTAVLTDAGRSAVSATTTVERPDWLHTWLAERAADAKPLRLVVLWRASPTAAEREYLLDELAPHVEDGLDLTVVMPYPRPNLPVRSLRPDLSARLVEAHGKVEAFAQVLRRRLSPDRQTHVRVYESAGSTMPPPPMWLRTLPLVLTFPMASERTPAPIELAEWILEPTGVLDRLAIAGGPVPASDDHRAAQVSLWRDYLGALIDDVDTPEESPAWRLVPPPELL